MFEEFEVKPLFEDQIHERYQFSLNHEGNDYNGVYHQGEISWFHPLPQNTLHDELLEEMEAQVHQKMQDHLS
ncbi:YheE family protein [Paenibacillus doosanensis]|uniref:Uncharacterized protein n=1 Tax=Paenibacillus konkukensis TaxID=2020716 RepID=A0ABY4RVC1_9BACL|nr:MULTISPECIES: DUF5342 family protein [Paenibacillus]MCS7460857.1 YheE family protein [Paenibacillus doosanensis]UQZ86280.1 hypothetical protein SK3146_05573 [Paenibacillus konkukensis]